MVVLENLFFCKFAVVAFQRNWFNVQYQHCNICMTTIFILYPRISYPKYPAIFPPSFQALVDRHETLHGYQTSNCFVEDHANPAKSK